MTPTTAAVKRLSSIDLLRGIAIALMILFHFSYDLNHFGFIQIDVYNDPFWLHARTFILSLFLLLVGISLSLATARNIHWRPYLRRLGLIAGCAALISLSSYLMFGPRWIFFGVLHFITVASVLCLPLVRLPWLALLLGVGLLALAQLFSHPFFDQAAFNWIGLMTFKPATEDYVPLIPWLGVVCIGVFLGHTLTRLRNPPTAAPAHPIATTFIRAGRHSLIIYMLHQPLLIGLLWALRRLIPA